MKALILSDLQWVDFDRWREFLKIDQSRFDVVFLLGDINQMMLERIRNVFRHKEIVGVHGDFGFIGDLEYFEITDCHGKVEQVGNYSVAGVEGAIRYKSGYYPMHTQEEISLICKKLPKVDILLCHNSPRGFRDIPDHPVYQGFEGITEYMMRCEPKYLFHGHHHINSFDQHGDTKIIGVFGAIIYDFSTDESQPIIKSEMA